MDFESPRSRELGCWDGIEFCTPAIDALEEPVGEDWVVDGDFVDAVLGAGLGDILRGRAELLAPDLPAERRRRRRTAPAARLLDQHARCARASSADQVYSVANAKEEITSSPGSSHAELRVIDGGQHFMSVSARRRQRSGRRVHRALELIDAVRVVVDTRRIAARYLPEPAASATVSAPPASAGRMHQPR